MPKIPGSKCQYLVLFKDTINHARFYIGVSSARTSPTVCLHLDKVKIEAIDIFTGSITVHHCDVVVLLCINLRSHIKTKMSIVLKN